LLAWHGSPVFARYKTELNCRATLALTLIRIKTAMTLLNVLHYPDKRLRAKAVLVAQFDAALHSTIDDMFETMYAEEGIGLAATQVNIHQRIIVIDISADKTAPLCVINPEILHREGVQYETEGCLSLPGVFDKVERAAKIRLRFVDLHGKTAEIEAEELLATCIQHEMDHLDGVLFLDHLSRLKQDRLRKKLEKILSRAE
jgi:peptide deformylase